MSAPTLQRSITVAAFCHDSLMVAELFALTETIMVKKDNRKSKPDLK